MSMFSCSSFTLTGKEAPVSKLLKTSQMHTDYRMSPLRLSGTLVLNASTSSVPLPTQKSYPVLSSVQKSSACKSGLFVKNPDGNASVAKSSKTNSSLKSNLTVARVKRSPGYDSKPQSKITSLQDKLGKVEAVPHNVTSSLDYSLPGSRVSEPRYVPYTLKDYRRIRQHSLKQLGGLGPNIGTEDWELKMRRRRKMIKYSRLISSPTNMKSHGGKTEASN
jgi:hypothetical protein